MERGALGLFVVRSQKLKLFPFTIQYEFELDKVQIWENGDFIETRALNVSVPGFVKDRESDGHETKEPDSGAMETEGSDVESKEKGADPLKN